MALLSSRWLPCMPPTCRRSSQQRKQSLRHSPQSHWRKMSSAILDQPAPSVFVESIADSRAHMTSFAYVGSQREVYTTRSDLLIRLLSDLPRTGIDLGTAPQQLQLINAPAVIDDDHDILRA